MRFATFIAVAALSAVMVDATSCHTRAAKGKHASRKNTAAKQNTLKSGSKAKNGTSSSKPAKSSNATAAATPVVASSSVSVGPSGAIKQNGVFIGMVPDEGDAGGQRQSLSQLNGLVGGKFATYGWYAQAVSGTPFDGSQILPIMDDLVKTGATLEAAVMPTKGWQGLTASDNSQAVRICNVMKQFTDKGVPTRLRFAHEVNFYQTDGTYEGNVNDFQAGWSAVGKACRKIAPKVQLFFTPNVAGDQSTYDTFFPKDHSLVDLIGIDFYPRDISNSQTFVNAMKPFHDKYTNSKIKFAIGETGLGFAGSIDQRLAWLKQVTDAKKVMPNLVSVSWFNFNKGYDFELVNPSSGSITAATKKALGI